MGQRGRKPTPVAVKKVTGNPGRRPMTTAVPQPRQGDILCPMSVQNDPRALAYWNMFLANAAPGHLAPLDAPLLARMVKALSRADKAEAELDATGLLVKAPNTGLPIQSPLLSIVNGQTRIAAKIADQLCLTPAERNRLGVHGPEEDDPTAIYFDAGLRLDA